MTDFVYDIMQNKTKTMVLRSIIFIIITIVIIEQVFILTKFIFKYSTYYDIGHFLKKVCDTNYTEYETERFQVANNIGKLKINHDDTNTKYDVVMFVFSVFVTLFINYVFVYIFVETVYNNVLATIIGILTPISGGFTTAILPLTKVLSEDLKDYLAENTIINILLMIVKAVCLLYIMFIIPISIIVKLTTNYDMSIIASDVHNKKTPDSDESFNLTKFLVNMFGHTFILIVIFLMQFSKPFVSKFTYSIFFIVFVVLYIFIMKMTDMYIEQKNRHKYKSDTSNEEMKNLEFAYNYMGDTNNMTSPYVTWLLNAFGMNKYVIKSQDEYLQPTDLKSFDKYIDTLDKKLPIEVNSFNSMVFIWSCMIIFVLIIYAVLFLKADGFTLGHIFDEGTKDRDMLYYFILIPLLFIFIIMFIIIATREYNTMINKYILYDPTHAYKIQTNNISKIFNKILVNDKATVLNNSVCQNTTNAIHLVLYTYLFNEYPRSKMFIPQFSYVSVCSPNDYINYMNAENYNPSTYLKDKFYNDAKCTQIDNQLLMAVMKSSVPEYKNKLLENSDLEQMKEKFKKSLKFAIYNINHKKTYDGSQALVITDEIDKNNQIVNIDILDSDIDNKLFNQDTLDIIEYVSNEYKKYLRILYTKTIIAIESLSKCNKLDDFSKDTYPDLIKKIEKFIQNDTNGTYSLNIKKQFIRKYNDILEELFGKINTKMTAHVKDDKNNYKLTKYIISNFNNYRTNLSEKHTKDTLHEITTTTEVAFSNDNISKYTDIEAIENIIQTLFKITDELYTLISQDTTYDKVHSKVIDLETNIDNLVTAKKNYMDIFKSRYYTKTNATQNNTQTNKNYAIQLIYDYKIQYIDSNITLHDNILKYIQNTNLFKNFDVIISTGETSIDVNLLQTRHQLQIFDFNQYKSSFNKYKDLYNNQYSTIVILTSEQKKSNDVPPLLDELLSNGMQFNAKTTGSLIYSLVLVYIFMVILANMIQ